MRPTSLKEAVDRIIGGESWVDAVREFLDEFYPSGPSERQRMIGEEPGLTGVAFHDAYVGAVGEHLARRWGLDIPAWTDDPRRFLDEPHFPDYMEIAKPVFLRDSPLAFRRRPILAEAEPLGRARFPIKASDHPGVERLRSTLRRLSRVVADDRFFYCDPARA
jgi:hypothetical protein